MSSTTKARRLRKNSTDAERALWARLRNRQLAGLKFRRQHPLGRYVVDFLCLDHRLIVEIDGGQHAQGRQKNADKIRDERLTRQGYRVLRFWNTEVLGELEGVLETIALAAKSGRETDKPPLTRPAPGGAGPPSPQGEG